MGYIKAASSIAQIIAPTLGGQLHPLSSRHPRHCHSYPMLTMIFHRRIDRPSQLALVFLDQLAAGSRDSPGHHLPCQATCAKETTTAQLLQHVI